MDRRHDAVGQHDENDGVDHRIGGRRADALGAPANPESLRHAGGPDDGREDERLEDTELEIDVLDPEVSEELWLPCPCCFDQGGLPVDL